MRIIAGSARGKALKPPKEPSNIRPTADRVRETVFNVLGQWMHGLRVLDLFAGTGALALEAISRGAASAVLVDSDRQAQTLCRTNAESLGFSSCIEIVPMRVDKALHSLRLRGQMFDLVFVDPPYAEHVSAQTLQGIVAHSLLNPSARVVLEHDKRESLADRLDLLEKTDERRFGDTVVTIYSLS